MAEKKKEPRYNGLTIHISAKKIKDETGFNKGQILEVLRAYHKVLIEEVKTGQPFKITGLGNFYVKYRRPRAAYDIYRGKKIEIPETMEPSFQFTGRLRTFVKKHIEINRNMTGGIQNRKSIKRKS